MMVSSEEQKNELLALIQQLKTEIEIMRVETTKNSQFLKILLKRNMTVKEEEIFDELKRRRIMDVNQVEDFMGWTARTASLKKMKRWGKIHPNIQFIKGSKSPQMPSRIMWVEEKNTTNYEKIIQLFDTYKTNRLPIRVIQKTFGNLEYRVAREMADILCTLFEGYEVSEEWGGHGSMSDTVFLLKK